MRIMHVITLAELGGAQSVVLNLALRGAEDGHDVMVVSSEHGELWKILPPSVRQYKIPALQREIGLLKDILAVKQLHGAYKHFRPDVIHLHSSKIGFLGRLAFPARKIVYTVHGFDSIRVAFRKFLYLERLLQRRTKHIVGVSRYDYENLIREGITSNVSFIYNGIIDHYSGSVPKEDPKIEQLKDQIGSKPGMKVMCIARISPQKNFPLFCEVARKMKSCNVHFFWIGNKQEISGIPENMSCLGEVDHAHRLLRYADLFILPSNYEGMPMSILEALCYRVPVVASDVGGVSEILNGKNGIGVENNADAFEKAIRSFIDDPDRMKISKGEARDSYEKYFTIESMYKQYLVLYKRA